MKIMLNDLSFHGQFNSIDSFKDAVDRIIFIRNIAKKFGHELSCHRNILNAQITSHLNMQKAVQKLDKNKNTAIMSWITRHGSFWEDERDHKPDDYMEYNNSIVTDTALAEAAWHCHHGNSHQLVSLAPSNWMFTPISVTWQRGNDVTSNINVVNYWEVDEFESTLRESAPPLKSWDDLALAMNSQCTNLIFSIDAFESLKGHPFVNGAAQRIVELLKTLDFFKTCFDDNGQRTKRGHELYQDHFVGEKAWFTDSSDSEKFNFNKELTFKHPTSGIDTLFSWHGKVKTPQIRIHFSWPIQANESLYIVYVGPKITKQ